MTEIELSILNRQCLNHRVPSQEDLTTKVEIWANRRNAVYRTVDWQCTSADARMRLKRLYPAFSS